MTTDRSGWIRTWVERAWQDVRYGGRMFAGNPGFAAIAVLSLAIGIGANTAIFSFADALLLRPLPVARPGEVLTVGSTSSADFFGSTLVSSYRDYVDIRDRAKSFDGLTAFIERHRRICGGRECAAAAEARHPREQQPALADGRDPDDRPRLSTRRGSGARPRRRHHPRQDALGAGVRRRPGRAREDRANQRHRLHRRSASRLPRSRAWTSSSAPISSCR